MNIKSITPQITSVESNAAKKAETKDQVKPEHSSADRDPNGQREDQSDTDRSPLSEEEFQRAKEYFETLEGVKTNHLKIRAEEKNGVLIFLIESPEGEIIRRIPDYEMRSLFKSLDKKTGQLIDKAG